MTDKIQKKQEPKLTFKMDFDEALARIVQTKPEEMNDAIERNRRDVADIGKRVDERHEKLQSAIKEPRKRFRI